MLGMRNDRQHLRLRLGSALAAMGLAMLTAGPGLAQVPESSEPIKVVINNWNSQLVLANIRPKVLIPAAARVLARLAPGGYLVLSGILDEEADDVLAAYADTLQLRARPSDTGWTALVMQRPAPNPERAT